MEPWTLVLFVVGLGLLVAGAEGLVRGASRLAGRAGISPLVIGLTVVAFGTSAPELAVSVRAALAGEADVAVGNVVGSNIFNVLFILGLTAAVVPLVVRSRLVWVDVPLLVVVSALVWWRGADGRIDRLEGLAFLGGGLAYTLFAVLFGRRDAARAAAVGEEAAPPRGAWWHDLLWVAAGLAGLVVGAGWLVDGAVAIARALGLSELIIGLTIIAGGTSLPEVATSVVAAVRGERDIAVGNVVGSCLFNLLVVLGAGAAVAPEGIAVAAAALAFDVPVMMATTLACLPIFFTGHRIARPEGLLFLGYYAAYVAFLVLQATEHDALPLFSRLMLLAVLPLTLLGVGVSVVRALRRRREA